MQARVILCHITRRVSEGTTVALAQAAGLVPCADLKDGSESEAPYRMLMFCLDK